MCMLMCIEQIKMMDSISNGLDTATTYDIVRANSALSKYGGTTMAIALLQVSNSIFVVGVMSDLMVHVFLRILLFSLLPMSTTSSRRSSS